MLIWVLLLFASWLAATISGAAGFGGALLLLPILTHTVGPKAAVPILTVAQLMGNLSRAWFGFKDIRWRPIGLFSLGAISASLLGSRLFVQLPPQAVLRGIAVFLFLMVVLRHTGLGKRALPDKWLLPTGWVVGLLSGLVGSAGPLSAAAFLGLRLPAVAYVASEATAVSLMHVTKALVYGSYAMMTAQSLILGLVMGGAMVVGSWTGRKTIERLSERWFSRLIEVLLLLSAASLLIP